MDDPEMTIPPAPRPAMRNHTIRPLVPLCESRESNPDALRRQILSLSTLVWAGLATRSSILLRLAFGEASQGPARAHVRHVPLPVPPTAPAYIPPCGQDQPGRPTAYQLAGVR